MSIHPPSTPAWGSATVFAEGVSYRCARRRSGEVKKKKNLFLGFWCFFHWFWFWTTKVMRENWIMSLQSSVNTTMIWNHNHVALAYMYIRCYMLNVLKRKKPHRWCKLISESGHPKAWLRCVTKKAWAKTRRKKVKPHMYLISWEFVRPYWIEGTFI